MTLRRSPEGAGVSVVVNVVVRAELTVKWTVREGVGHSV